MMGHPLLMEMEVECTQQQKVGFRQCFLLEFTEGIVAAQEKQSMHPPYCLHVKCDRAGACAAKSLERIHHSEIQHATQSMAQ